MEVAAEEAATAEEGEGEGEEEPRGGEAAGRTGRAAATRPSGSARRVVTNHHSTVTPIDDELGQVAAHGLQLEQREGVGAEVRRRPRGGGGDARPLPPRGWHSPARLAWALALSAWVR